jgi:hypothetical protein
LCARVPPNIAALEWNTSEEALPLKTCKGLARASRGMSCGSVPCLCRPMIKRERCPILNPSSEFLELVKSIQRRGFTTLPSDCARTSSDLVPRGKDHLSGNLILRWVMDEGRNMRLSWQAFGETARLYPNAIGLSTGIQVGKGSFWVIP